MLLLISRLPVSPTSLTSLTKLLGDFRVEVSLLIKSRNRSALIPTLTERSSRHQAWPNTCLLARREVPPGKKAHHPPVCLPPNTK